MTGKLLLHTAIMEGNREVVSLLLSEMSDLNIKDDYDHSPVREAALKGDRETVKLLISGGADISNFGSLSPFKLLLQREGMTINTIFKSLISDRVVCMGFPVTGIRSALY